VAKARSFISALKAMQSIGSLAPVGMMVPVLSILKCVLVLKVTKKQSTYRVVQGVVPIGITNPDFSDLKGVPKDRCDGRRGNRFDDIASLPEVEDEKSTIIASTCQEVAARRKGQAIHRIAMTGLDGV